MLKNNDFYRFFEKELSLGKTPIFGDYKCEEIKKDNSLKAYSRISTFNKIEFFLSLRNIQEVIIYPNFQYSLKFIGDKREQGSLSEEDYIELSLSVRLILNRRGIGLNPTHPFASFGHSFGDIKARFSLVHSSISRQGNTFFIRRVRGSEHDLKIEQFIDCRSTIEVLKHSIHQKKIILICGETGSGKTTLLQTLLQLGPSNQNNIILEDAEEIDMTGREHTKLIAQNKKLSELVAFSLRMTPDRLVLGEIRSHEVIPYVLAISSGQPGLISTIHSFDAVGAIERLGLLFSLYATDVSARYENLQQILAKNIDLIVYVKDKRIAEIISPVNSMHGKLTYKTIFTA